jgi:hypothetical protein
VSNRDLPSVIYPPRPEDRATEDRVGSALAYYWDPVTPLRGTEPRDQYDRVDYCLDLDGTTVGFAEVKGRPGRFDRWATQWVAADKYRHLTGLEHGTRSLGLYVVAYADGIKWVRLSSVRLPRLSYLDRRDRPEVPPQPGYYVASELFLDVSVVPRWLVG